MIILWAYSLRNHSFCGNKPGHAVYKRLSQLKNVKEVHISTDKPSSELPLFKMNTLMHMHAKRGGMEEARQVFDNMEKRDVVSWSIMILGYANREDGAQALELYARMHQQGVRPSPRTFVGAVKACSSLAALEEGNVQLACLNKGRAIHCQVVKSGFQSDVFLGNSLVNMYAKCKTMEDAQSIFDGLAHRDVVTWTTVILGYVEQKGSELALELYARMHQEGVTANHRTFVGALKACSGLAAVEEGKQVNGQYSKMMRLVKGRAIHCQVVKSGLESNVFVGTTLVDMYTKNGNMEDARCVFDTLPHRNVATWNSMILGYAETKEGALALELCAPMQQEGIVADHRTFSGVLKACSSLAELEDENQPYGKFGCLVKGRAIHSEVLKSGLESDMFVGTTLVDMYVKCGNEGDARYVFDDLPHRDVVTWTTMILGYADHEELDEAFRLYELMHEHGLSPGSLTFASILKACGNSEALEMGRKLHSQVSRAGFDTSAVVGTSLVDMYAKCGSMVDAQQLFDTFPTRDIVRWNALIAGYARHGESELAFNMLGRMRQRRLEPDGITFLSILNVCSHVGLVDDGQGYFCAMSKQYGFIPSIDHYTCMVDLLGRAGQLDRAVAVVENMPFQPNIVVWLTLLGACQNRKNVDVGRHAFKNAVRLDGKLSAAYVLMANIYADADMREDCEKIQVVRKIAQAWKKSGRCWWTDISRIVDTLMTGPQTTAMHSKMKDLFFKMQGVRDLELMLQEIL